MTPDSNIIGIDPGRSGALAFVRGSQFPPILFDMPMKKVMNRHEVDGVALGEVLSKWRTFCSVAVIEHVHSMPSDGVASAFIFGLRTGAVLGILQSLDFQIIRVHPAVWKSHYGLSSDKQKSLDLAKKFFPQCASALKYKKYDGRAEALLMAHFATTCMT